MKKNKGFTLIELLAVIVVLAIIALIATPIVMKIIKVSKERTVENSVINYIREVEVAITLNKIQTSNTISDGKYNINDDGNICLDDECTKTIDINMNGDNPESGTITITNGQVVSVDDMIIKNYKVSYTLSDDKYVVTEVTENDSVKILCTAKSTPTNGNLATGKYNYGDEYSCDLGDREEKTFYVLEDGDTSTLGENGIAKVGEVSLIMNMPINKSGKGIPLRTWGYEFSPAWSSDGKTENGPVTALAYLESSIESWKYVEKNQISLPTYNQIFTAAGIKNNTQDLPYWLYENVHYSGGPYGYWTSTSYSNDKAWYVNGYGVLASDTVSYNEIYVIVPVITIPKNQLES